MTLPLSHAIPISFYRLVKSVEGQGGKKWKVSPYYRRKSNYFSVVVILAAVCISISAPKYASSAGSCVCWAARRLRWCRFSRCGFDGVRSHGGTVDHVHEGGNLIKILVEFCSKTLEMTWLAILVPVEQAFTVPWGLWVSICPKAPS